MCNILLFPLLIRMQIKVSPKEILCPFISVPPAVPGIDRPNACLNRYEVSIIKESDIFITTR